MKQPAEVLYVARYRWPFRMVAVLFAALFVFLRPSVTKMWEDSGWFIGLAVLVAYLFAVLGLLETFVRQTWLTSTGIHQRSMFGQTRFVPYGQIQELVIKRDEALLVKYQNNRSVKVHAKEGDPEAIIDAARPFLNPDIRVAIV